jgi:hypothetical protein
VPFERAWEWASKRCVYPADRQLRDQYREAVRWSRPAFEAAYHDQEVPGGRASLNLAQVLANEGNYAESATTALQYHVPAEDRRVA